MPLSCGFIGRSPRTAPPPSPSTSPDNRLSCRMRSGPGRAPRIASHMMISTLSAPPSRTKSACVMSEQLLGRAHEQFHELAVPVLVVEPGALAMHLVRQPAGAHRSRPSGPAERIRWRGAPPGRACSSAAPSAADTAPRSPTPAPVPPAMPGRAASAAAAARTRRDPAAGRRRSRCRIRRSSAARPGESTRSRLPLIAGSGRFPPPSSATSNSSTMPTAKVGYRGRRRSCAHGR